MTTRTRPRILAPVTEDDPVVIDPRIRARRDEVQREADRRRWRITLLAGALFVAAGLVYLALQSPALDVDHVRVEGVQNIGAADVVDAAGVERGGALFSVDTGAVRTRVERLPWVASASVTRSWPGTVRIEVREHRPVAWARRDADTVALFAPDGRVIADVPTVPRDAVEVTGLRRIPAVGALLSPPDAAGVVDRLPPTLAARITAVDLGADGVALAVDTGGVIRLGDLEDLDAKATAAEAVLAARDGRPFAYIDVRVPQNPVVGSVPTVE